MTKYAFPGSSNAGMELRDWFAGQALTGLCVDYNDGEHYKHVAETAYRQADAMMAVRTASATRIAEAG